jgi:hypothetical protein
MSLNITQSLINNLNALANFPTDCMNSIRNHFPYVLIRLIDQETVLIFAINIMEGSLPEDEVAKVSAASQVAAEEIMKIAQAGAELFW